MRLTLLTCCLTLSLAANAAAETMPTHFSEAEAAVKAATDASAKASAALRGCHQGTLQFQFAASAKQLEWVRKALEGGRRETQAYRSGLEGVRRQIESSKGETYAERLATEYALPMDEKVVPLLKGYAEGIEAWSAIFVKYGAFCAEPGFTKARGAQFVTATAADIEAVSKRSAELAASAQTAKGTLPVAVASHR